MVSGNVPHIAKTPVLAFYLIYTFFLNLFLHRNVSICHTVINTTSHKKSDRIPTASELISTCWLYNIKKKS
jgi:hypothetical protein